MTAVLAAALSVALVLGGLTVPAVLLVAVLLAQTLLAVGWFPALQAASPRGGMTVALAAAAAADVAVLTGEDNRPLAQVGPVLGLAVVAAFGHQLLRRDGRPGLTGSLTATTTLAVLGALGSAWLALDVSRDGTALLVIAAATAAVAPVADAVSTRFGAPAWVGPVGAAALSLAAAVVVALASTLDLVPAVAAAAGGAVAARLGLLFAARAAAPHPLLPAALPAVLVAPAVYVLGRVLVG